MITMIAIPPDATMTITSMREHSLALGKQVKDHCGLGPLHTIHDANSAPSASEELVIKDLISTCLPNIATLESYVKEVADLLEILHRINVETKQVHDRCRVVLDPFRRLPPEILREIFLAIDVGNVPDTRLVDCSVILTAAPWNLVRVCHSWRNIALSTPRLWSRFHFDLSRLGASQAQEKNWVASTKLRLSRAKNVGLEVYIKAVSGSRMVDRTDIINLVVESAPRWQSLEIELATSTVSRFTAFANNLPLLQKLTLSYQSNLPDMSSDAQPIAFFHAAPSLREVVVKGIKEVSELILLPWEQITAYTDHGPRRISHHLAVLRLASNLQHFTVDGEITREDRLYADNPNFPLELVKHETLESLTVGAMTFDVEAMLPLLELPKLEALAIFGAPALRPYQEMLLRSECTLKRVALLLLCGSAWEMDEEVAFLRPHSHIEHLEVIPPDPFPAPPKDQPDVSGAMSLLQYPPKADRMIAQKKAPPPRHRKGKGKGRIPILEKLDAAVEEQRLKELDTVMKEANAPLLPHLKTIRATHERFRFNVDALAAVESRFGLPKDVGVTPLECMYVHCKWEAQYAAIFTRLRQMGLQIVT